VATAQETTPTNLWLVLAPHRVHLAATNINLDVARHVQVAKPTGDGGLDLVAAAITNQRSQSLDAVRLVAQTVTRVATTRTVIHGVAQSASTLMVALVRHSALR